MAKILMVDDEHHIDILIKQKFRKEIKGGQYDFHFARNGLEALEKIDREPDISLVISDINMPEMDGLTLLEHLDKVNPKIKTIIVSAYNDKENVKVAMDRGAYDFITKPIDLNDLRDTLQRTLNQNDLTREEMVKAQHNQTSLQEELEIASKLQQSILPTQFPNEKEVQVFATMQTALDVGGDFYDYFWISPSELGVVMADVSGKGISAALFMGMARTLIKMTAMASTGPADCLRKVNKELLVNNESAMFVTLFYGVLDTTTGTFSYSNGGHCYPYLLSAGKCRKLDLPPGTALGVMEGGEYTQLSTVLNPGCSVFLYTDGITEAMNKNGIEFSEKRLENSLARHYDKSMEALVEGVVLDVKTFADQAPQSDDLTCLALKYRPHA